MTTTRCGASKAASLGTIASTLYLAGLPNSAGTVTLTEIQGRGSVRLGGLTGASPMGMIDERRNPGTPKLAQFMRSDIR